MTREEEIAWAAGLFEGEGSVALQPSKVGKQAPRVRLQVYSTDRDVLEQFLRIVRFGKIYGPYTRPDRTGIIKSRKPIYEWVVNRDYEVCHIAMSFRPWLGARRLEAVNRAITFAMRRICSRLIHQGTVRNGEAHVPLDAWSQLASSLGEE